MVYCTEWCVPFRVNEGWSRQTWSKCNIGWCIRLCLDGIRRNFESGGQSQRRSRDPFSRLHSDFLWLSQEAHTRKLRVIVVMSTWQERFRYIIIQTLKKEILLMNGDVGMHFVKKLCRQMGPKETSTFMHNSSPEYVGRDYLTGQTLA